MQVHSVEYEIVQALWKCRGNLGLVVRAKIETKEKGECSSDVPSFPRLGGL